MSSEFRIPALRPAAAALGLACLTGLGQAHAGDVPVAPLGPVFGPVFVPVPGPGTGGPAQQMSEAQMTAAGASAAATLSRAAKFCGKLVDRYQVDCISDRIAAAAAMMPKTGDYAESWAALDSASKQLSALAKDAWDRETPRINAWTEGPDPVRASRPLRAIQPERVPEVRAEAVRILEETQTVLLRSTSRSAERQAQFVEIAQAVDSNKVLLRS